MNTDTKPEALNVPLHALINLGIEHWRLSCWLAKLPVVPATAQARHAVRRMEDFLKLLELEFRNMDGHPFDAGLSVHVVDTIDDPESPDATIVVDETVSPMVLLRGQVIKAADVVTRRGTRK